MAEEFNLIAEMRDDQGKGASRRLRKKGKVPAVIYGAGRKPRSIMFDHNKVIKELERIILFKCLKCSSWRKE